MYLKFLTSNHIILPSLHSMYLFLYTVKLSFSSLFIFFPLAFPRISPHLLSTLPPLCVVHQSVHPSLLIVSRPHRETALQSGLFVSLTSLPSPTLPLCLSFIIPPSLISQPPPSLQPTIHHFPPDGSRASMVPFTSLHSCPPPCVAQTHSTNPVRLFEPLTVPHTRFKTSGVIVYAFQLRCPKV